MGSIGVREILVIVLIIVILFGARRIPELAKGMGQGIKEFKRGMRDSGDDTPPAEKPAPRDSSSSH